MRGIVLSGGGGKGAYQVGCFKALRKLKMEYNVVTGTSIGALNGLLMAQKEFYKCLWLWHHIDFNHIYDDFDSNDPYHEYFKKVLDGGIKTNRIEKIINSCFNAKKLYNSSIDYGVVAFNLSKMKPIMACKNNTKPQDLKKYIMASATCFPVFKPSKINDEVFVDGGYYDNMPINLAIELGATSIIAIDLKSIGLKKKVKDQDIKITYITPNNKLSSFLLFEKEASKKMIKFGYNDTMKVFKKLDGKVYTFKRNDLFNNYERYNQRFISLTKYYLQKDKSILDLYNKITDIERVVNNKYVFKIMSNLIEKLGKIFEMEESHIYDVRVFNKQLISHLEKTEVVNIKGKTAKEILSIVNHKNLIRFIYDHLQEKIDKKTYNIFCLFPDEFLMAVYLKCL